jgi:hypothetical protein
MSLLHRPDCVAKISQCHNIINTQEANCKICTTKNNLKDPHTKNEQQSEDKCLVLTISNISLWH